MRILLWFRNNLRLHDHEPLQRSLEQNAIVIPVYCFDPRQFGQTSFGFPKTAAYRAHFLLESVTDLRNSLQAKGSHLIIRHGKPEEEIPTIAKTLNVDAVYWHEEVTSEELAIDATLEKQLTQLKIGYEVYWGSTLYHPDDLPFKVSQVPNVFTSFRKQVEKGSSVYLPFSTPEKLPPLPKIELGELPTLDALGLTKRVPDSRGVLPFKGGETEAINRLQHYFWDVDQLRVYKQTRNGMLGANYSSKLSPWLALGCLSPRRIYAEVGVYETERVRNDSTYWLIFELLWRDFFRFTCAKHGDTVFYPSGLRGLRVPWKQDWQRFELWTRGETGYPLVDANMRELAATGFMSNRGRQNVASFLTKNLGIDWRMGAEWFESLLIDYDVCSNWGNWNYTAGVGNDARGFRYFNIPKQSKDYDPDGRYVKHWLPELQKLPRKKIHSPWQLTAEEQKRCHVRLGIDYPNPVIDLEKSVRTNEAIYNTALEIRR